MTVQVSGFPDIVVMLAGTIGLFGLVVLFMQFLLIRKSPDAQPDDALRLFTVTMVIVGTLALIVCGYSTEQIAPALGLFGTIVGDLSGRTNGKRREKRNEEKRESSNGI